MKETSETTPAELLSDFNSRGLKGMILFTIVVHLLLILATSGSYIWHSVTGKDTSKLSESERLELATKEAQTAMRRIAEQHGIKPQDLGSNFNSPTAAPTTAPQAKPDSETKAETGSSPAETAPPAPEQPKSAIEKELKEAKPGPTIPTDEDLFK